MEHLFPKSIPSSQTIVDKCLISISPYLLIIAIPWNKSLCIEKKNTVYNILQSRKILVNLNNIF